jgi:hypothetical protein
MSTKRLFQVFDEMNVNDEKNKTALLPCAFTMVEAKTAKGGGHVTMGVEAGIIQKLFLGEVQAVLVVFDKKEYHRLADEPIVDKLHEAQQENERLKKVNQGQEDLYWKVVAERDKLKERCDKMETALKKVKSKLNWLNDSDEIAIITEALKEGESNTPAPVRQKDIYIFHNNSDAFRQWVTEIKGYVIVLLSHSTGIVLPMGITREMFEMEWKEYEKANNPKYQQ